MGLFINQEYSVWNYRSKMGSPSRSFEYCIFVAVVNSSVCLRCSWAFTKPFNIIWRHGIFIKRNSHGVRRNYLFCLSNYLSDTTSALLSWICSTSRRAKSVSVVFLRLFLFHLIGILNTHSMLMAVRCLTFRRTQSFRQEEVSLHSSALNFSKVSGFIIWL